MLNKDPFYYQLSKKYIVAFGSIFSDIHIQRRENDNTLIKDIKVPITYAGKEKYMYYLNNRQDELGVSTILPRIGFLITDIVFDSSRKTNSLNEEIVNSSIAIVPVNSITGATVNGDIAWSQDGIATDGYGTILKIIDNTLYIKILNGEIKSSDSNIDYNVTVYATQDTTMNSYEYLKESFMFAGNPYNYTFDMYILARNFDDLFQIIEQVTSFFSPDLSLSIKEIPEIEKTRDVSVVLNSVTLTAETDFGEDANRVVSAELNFTLKGWIYPPISNAGVIEIININFLDKDTSQLIENSNIFYDRLTEEILTHKSPKFNKIVVSALPADYINKFMATNAGAVGKIVKVDMSDLIIWVTTHRGSFSATDDIDYDTKIFSSADATILSVEQVDSL